MENISSEQELKQLLEDGKISEEEYQQLLEAMQKKPKSPPQQIDSAQIKKKPKHKLGITAFILMLAGLVWPVAIIIIAAVFSLGIGWIIILPPAFLLALAAMILGIIAFSSGWGKATVICISLLMLLALPMLLVAGLFTFRKVVISAPPLPTAIVSHKAWPLDSLDGILTKNNVQMDNSVSADGNGSLKIQQNNDSVIRIFETGPISIQNRLLFYNAKLRTKNLNGKAFLEMWCDIPGRGEFFSRSLQQPVTGTTEWTSVQTPFRLEPGQTPANLKLNLIIEGTGTVWIDNIKLLSGPLN